MSFFPKLLQTVDSYNQLSPLLYLNSLALNSNYLLLFTTIPTATAEVSFLLFKVVILATYTKKYFT